MVTRLMGWLVLLACLVIATGAVAQDDPARQQFRQAQQFYDQGEFALALPLFQEALKTSSSPNARLYVARTLRELGRLTEAHDQFHRTFEEASKLTESEPKYAPTRDAAAAELARVQERVARVVVALPEEFAAATVTLNDRTLAADEIGIPLAFEPGEVRVHVEMEGTGGFDKAVELAEGQLETVAVVLTRDVQAPPSPPEPKRTPTEGGGIGVIRAAGIGVAGLGVAGLVVMGVTGSMAQSKKNQLADECGGQRCTDPAKAELVDDGKKLKLIANVMLGVGAALTVGGIAMIVWGGPDDDGSSSAWLAPAPLPGGGGMMLSGRF